MSYKEYINSEEWERKREEVFEIYGEICFFCGGYIQIQIHHIHYKNLKNEKKGDLIPLCGLCHNQLHKDPQFLKEFLGRVKNKKIEIKEFIPLK